MQIYKEYCAKSSEIVLLFGGFSAHPSHFINFFPKDLILLYHYTHLDFTALLEILSALPKTIKITLIAFSMGVFVARVFLESYKLSLKQAIAINGTEYGIHTQYGIPLKLFKYTQLHFDAEAFKRNMFGMHLSDAFMFRDCESLRKELLFFLESCTRIPKPKGIIEWDCAYIAKKDLIFSPSAQIAFWANRAPMMFLDAPHFAFPSLDLKL